MAARARTLTFFGQNVRRIRDASGLTQKRVAKKADLDPSRFTVRTLPGLLKKTKAWEGYDDAAGSIADAIKKLGKRAAAA